MAFNPGFEMRELELLKTGRHFRLSPKTKLIVGRNEDENNAIVLLAKKDDLLLTTSSVPGPDVLVTGEITKAIEDLASEITVSYSDAKTGETMVDIKHAGKDKGTT